MSDDLKAKLAKLKELQELGLLTQAEFDAKRMQLVEDALGSVASGHPFSGATRMGPPSEPSDPLAGATRMGQPPEPADPLAGATRMGPPSGPADPLAGATRGLTVMGRLVTASETDVTTLPAGSMFDGRYAIVSVLGVGGMGAVYQAVDTRLEQTVAVKALRPEVVERPEVVATLTQEVKLAQRLQHPNLLDVHHLEARGDAPYVVMELMDGGDLEAHLLSRGGVLEASEAHRILSGVCAGLTALHAGQVVHLDVKPANVLLSRSGGVKLSDFGISSRVREASKGAGTVEYAPPEQLAGEQCDVRADVYAVGVMTYQVLTGRLPYGDPAKAAAWHAEGERSFPGVSPQVAGVLRRATAVSADGRYRTMAQLWEALSGALSGRSWFPVPASVVSTVSGRLANTVSLPGGACIELSDPEGAVAAGGAYPGWRLSMGRVVPTGTHLSLAWIGASEACVSDEVREAFRSAQAGDTGALAECEPELYGVAVACALCGDREEAIRRIRSLRASRATDVLRVATTGLLALGRKRDARGLAQQGQEAAQEVHQRLDWVAYIGSVLGDRDGMLDGLAATEARARTGSDWLHIVCAHVAFRTSQRSVSRAMQQLRAASAADLDVLTAAVYALGSHPLLHDWLDERVEACRQSPEDLERLLTLLRKSGHEPGLERAGAAHIALLGEEAAAQDAKLAAMGVQLPAAALTWAAHVARRELTSAQERHHEVMQALTPRAAARGVPLPAAGSQYDPAVIAALRERVEGAEMLVQETVEWALSHEVILEPSSGETPEHLEQRGLEVVIDSIRSRGRSLGLQIELPGHLSRASVENAARVLTEQQELDQQATELDVSLSRLGASSDWALPVSEVQLDTARDRLRLLEALTRRVEVVAAHEKTLGLQPDDRPSPLTEQSVVAAEHAVSRGLAELAALQRHGERLGVPLVSGDGQLPRMRELVAAAQRRHRREMVLKLLQLGRVYAPVWLPVSAVGMLSFCCCLGGEPDAEACAAARADATPASWRTYLADFPEGQCVAEAEGVLVLESIEWVKIPGGQFQMGRQDDGSVAVDADEQPLHEVRVRPFYLMKSEVTMAQYSACVAVGGCTAAHVTDERCHVWSGRRYVKGVLPSRFMTDPAQPVVCVSRQQAREFARWAGGRLPTEAEWEYAAQSAGRGWSHPWGNEEPTCSRAVMNEDSKGCGRMATWPVCSMTSGNSAQGVCDLSGNVSEWVEDGYHETYDGAPTDGTAWQGSGGVTRGGSWGTSAKGLRASSRQRSNSPSEGGDALGFRLAR